MQAISKNVEEVNIQKCVWPNPSIQDKRKRELKMIIFGGTEERIRQQLKCNHDWYGPCIDLISRYYKCKICFCLDRDCTEEDYYESMKEERNE